MRPLLVCLAVFLSSALFPGFVCAQEYYEAEGGEFYSPGSDDADLSPSSSPAGSLAPSLHGEFSFELQDDWTLSADHAADERNDLYGTIESELHLGLTDRIGVEAALVLEPVRDLDPDENGFFDNEGLYVEQLKLVWQGESLGAFVGKYNPAFGVAWDAAPGIWGTDFAEDYELTERLGAGGSARWESSRWGRHALTAGTFFTDTSFLSESWIENRGNTGESDGGPSNTESLSSFALALDGRDPAAISGLSYHIAARYQAQGDADAEGDDETGWVAGAAYGFYLADRYRLDVLGEYADFSHFDAGADDSTYLTAGGRLTIDEKWNVSTSWTGRDVDIDAGGSDSDHLLQISGGYAFENGIQVDAGWRNASESDESSNALGAKLAYEWEF